MKIHYNKRLSGATLILSLLLLLICSFGGSVALAASGANAERYVSSKEDGGDRAAVISAARLFAEQLSASPEAVYTYIPGYSPDNPFEANEPQLLREYVYPDGGVWELIWEDFAKLVDSRALELLPGNWQSPEPPEFYDCEVELTVSGEGLPDVEATLTVTEDGIRARFTAGGCEAYFVVKISLGYPEITDEYGNDPGVPDRSIARFRAEAVVGNIEFREVDTDEKG